jgi:hypothetical protein
MQNAGMRQTAAPTSQGRWKLSPTASREVAREAWHALEIGRVWGDTGKRPFGIWKSRVFRWAALGSRQRMDQLSPAVDMRLGVREVQGERQLVDDLSLEARLWLHAYTDSPAHLAAAKAGKRQSNRDQLAARLSLRSPCTHSSVNPRPLKPV